MRPKGRQSDTRSRYIILENALRTKWGGGAVTESGIRKLMRDLNIRMRSRTIQSEYIEELCDNGVLIPFGSNFMVGCTSDRAEVQGQSKIVMEAEVEGLVRV